MGAIADFINSLGAISQNKAEREGRSLHRNQGQEALQDSSGSPSLPEAFRNIGLSQLTRNVAEQGDISNKGINQGPNALIDAWENPSMVSDLSPEVTSSAFSRDGGKPQKKDDKQPEQAETETAPTNKLKEAWDSDEPWRPELNPDSTKRPPKAERNLSSQLEEWYDFLENTDAGKEIAAAHPEYADRNAYGYSALRGSGDADTYAAWIANDPRVARRFRASGVDVDDIDNLANNVFDYMWGDNAINLYDYMTSDRDYSIGNDLDDIKDLAGYMYNNYGYGFPDDAESKYGLDLDDITAQMLARQISGYGYGDALNKYGSLDEINSLLTKAGYLEPGESLTFKNANSNEYSNSKELENLARKYTNPILDEYLPSDGIFDERDRLIGSLMSNYNNVSPTNLRLALNSKKAAPKTASDSEAYLGY